MPKLKREEAGPLSKTEHQKLQKLYAQGGAADGSVRNLVEASSLPVSKVRKCLHSKVSDTKSTLAHLNSREWRHLIDSKRNWCMELAYVDKLVKDRNGVKYLLARQDRFDETVDAEGMKTKDFNEAVSAFLNMI